jgi:SAM-dependent methyltransferase
MNDFFTSSFRSPLYLLKRLQKACIRKNGPSLKGRLLDLGCGSSPYKKFMACENYIGLERKPLPNVRVVGEGEALPFRNGVFDSLAATEVLEHVYKFRECANEINRVLKKDGMAYISVPMSWPIHYEPYDFFRFTVFGIRRLFEETGFEVVSTQKLGGAFILIGTHLSLFTWDTISKIFRFLGPGNAERIAGIFVLPVTLIFAILSIFDRFETKAAVGWSIMIRKR